MKKREEEKAFAATVPSFNKRKRGEREDPRKRKRKKIQNLERVSKLQ